MRRVKVPHIVGDQDLDRFTEQTVRFIAEDDFGLRVGMTMMPSLFTPIIASGAASSIAWKMDSPATGEAGNLRCSTVSLKGP